MQAASSSQIRELNGLMTNGLKNGNKNGRPSTGRPSTIPGRHSTPVGYRTAREHLLPLQLRPVLERLEISSQNETGTPKYHCQRISPDRCSLWTISSRSSMHDIKVFLGISSGESRNPLGKETGKPPEQDARSSLHGSRRNTATQMDCMGIVISKSNKQTIIEY